MKNKKIEMKMDINKKHMKLNKWFDKKYNNYNINLVCYFNDNPTYLRIETTNWDKWENLLRKYTEEQLIDYFTEIVRKELPELKGTKLFFTSAKVWDVRTMDKLPHRFI